MKNLYEQLHRGGDLDLEAVKEMCLWILFFAQRNHGITITETKALCQFLMFSTRFLSETDFEGNFTAASFLKLYICEDFNVTKEREETGSVLSMLAEEKKEDDPKLYELYQKFDFIKEDLPGDFEELLLSCFEIYCRENEVEFNRDKCIQEAIEWRGELLEKTKKESLLKRDLTTAADSLKHFMDYIESQREIDFFYAKIHVNSIREPKLKKEMERLLKYFRGDRKFSWL